MYDEHVHKFAHEFYTIEKTIEVVVSLGPDGESRPVRLEALRCEKSGRYSARAYVEEHITVQPTYPQKHSKYTQPPRDMRVWEPLSGFPWTDRASADEVLTQALSFLKERCVD